MYYHGTNWGLGKRLTKAHIISHWDRRYHGTADESGSLDGIAELEGAADGSDHTDEGMPDWLGYNDGALDGKDEGESSKGPRTDQTAG